eukprot:GFKZ01004928.1.p1 GENE.GFKZ01004928.1~~GFKZ01004928.1.p1  ORF type:complete len:320 (+),score=46.19 GFKZ01004928.1:53-961(+)
MPRNDNIPDDASAWDGIASDYNRHVTRFTTLHATDLLSAAQPALESATTILDIACGPGAAPLAYLSLFPDGIPNQTFIATDYSPAMVALAEARVAERVKPGCSTAFRFQVEDALTLDGVPDASVDVVVSVFGVFLVSPRERVFRQIRRVLKPGGVFANAAWTALPAEADVRLADSGFGRQFQQTVQQVMSKVLPSPPDSEAGPPPWQAWTDPAVVRTLLEKERFGDISVHRTIHTTTFRNVTAFWNLVSKTCPFADLSETTADKLEEVKGAIRQAFGVRDNDVLFMIMTSNLSVCALHSDDA